jgi:hypothetical protein
MTRPLDPQRYYRLPFSLTDNAISWLEVTTECNLDCKGCYRDTESAEGHKTLDEISAELDVFQRERNSDSMSIAGGDPLVHPQIVEIVRMIRRRGWKPVLNTNGLALNRKRLHDLKEAGAYGFTFHVDTSQVRKDAPGAKSEKDLNALRLKFAHMLADEGGLSCSFNQTVTDKTLDQVPDVMRWALDYPDIVHSVVFILYRQPEMLGNRFDYYANGKRITVDDDYKKPDDWGKGCVNAQQVVDQMRTVDPEFEPCAYLGGSVNPQSTKWLLANRVANRHRNFGYMSPRGMEIIQNVHHMATGNWLAYSSPDTLGMARANMFASSLVDKSARKAAWRFLRNGVANPRELFEKAYTQAFLVIQPIDLLADGRADMCDGCPDMTVYNGKLYYSCRLEEVKRYGNFVTAVPKEARKKLPTLPQQVTPQA